jgi:nanoRNase/pAp phosphatase (c-di-AMP/oligoRNAs hydrolase)
MPLQLAQYLESNKERLSPLLILMHDYPDPDALASAYALQFIAEHLYGIRTKIVHGAFIGRIENKEMVRLLRIPAHTLHPSDFRKFTNVALVDTQPAFDNNQYPPSGKPAIIIDQHATASPPQADFLHIDTEAGATSTILARELLALEVQIPIRLATALVYGILSDTLDFYRAAKRETVETYLKLLPMSDVRILAKIQKPDRPRKFFRDLARGITQAQVRQKLIVSHLGPVESPDLVSQTADFLLTCKGIQWVFCTGRHRDTIHVSLRTSKPDGEAGDILRSIFEHPRQAGGHGQIAGGKIRVGQNKEGNNWTHIENTLADRLAGRLHLRTKTLFQPLIRVKDPARESG